MSFDYQMTADPSQAIDASRKVEDSLTGVERHAKAVGVAINKGFDAKPISQAEEELTQMTVSFSDMARMLERIHGPNDQLIKDQRVLNELRARGAIDAKQHAAALAESQRAAGQSSGSGFLGSLNEDAKSVGGNIKSQLLGFVGPAALAAAAFSDITKAFDDWKQRKADIAEATNTIAKFYDSMDGARAAMGEQKQLSADLGINITKTAKAYAAVREATADFGLSSKEMTDITRNLTAALVVDGGAIESVGTIMQKLQYATETGVLTQHELRGIWKDSPEVVHSFEKSIGVTYQELLRMAQGNELTGATLEKMIRGLGQTGEAMDKFRDRNISIRQLMDENHLSFGAAAKLLIELKQNYEDVGESAEQAIDRIVQQTGRLIRTVETANNAIYASQALVATIPGVMAVQQYNKDLATQKDELEKIRGPQREYHQRVDNLNAMLKAGVINQSEFNNRMNELNGTHKKAAASTREHAEAIKELRNMMLSMDDASKVARGMGVRSAVTGEYEDFEGARGLGVKASDMDTGELQAKVNPATTAESRQKTLEYQKQLIMNTKAWNDELRATGDMTEVYADQINSAATSLADTLIDAATGAETSWSDFFSGLASGFAKAIAKAWILKGLTGNVDGSIGAGVGGGYGGLLGAIFGGSHAEGGAFTARGSGGSDSIPVLVNMSPNETAYFVPEGRRSPWDVATAGAASAPSSAAPVNLSISMPGGDADDVLQAMDSRAGDQLVYGMLRRSRRALRALARRRR